MLSIQKGEDLLSISLNNILSFREEEKEFIELVVDWDKNIIIEFNYHLNIWNIWVLYRNQGGLE